MNKLIDNFTNKLVRFVTPKRVFAIIAILFSLSIIPLIWIGIYNFPSADDFSYGYTAKFAYESGGLFSMLISAFNRAWNSYLNWEGCFLAEFLMAFPPHSINMSLYVLVCPVAIISLTLGTLYLVWQIMVGLLKADKYLSASIGLILSLLILQCMPVSGRVEMLYWYTGVANYSFVHGLEMFFLGTLIRLYRHKRDGQKVSMLKIVLISILGFCVGGAGLMTAFNAVLVICIGVLLIFINGKWNFWKVAIAPAISEAVGFLLNLIAPGNYARASVTEGLNPIRAIFAALYRGLDLCINEWTSWIVIVCLVLMVLIFMMSIDNTSFEFKYPLLVFILGYLLTSATMVPALVGAGSIDAGRLQALTFFVYIMNLAVSLLYLIGWIKKNAGNSSEKNCKIGIASCLFVMLFGVCLDVAAEPYSYSFSSATVDIVNGSAKQYYSELSEWHEVLSNADGGDVILQQLTVEPPILYFYEIHDDPNEWQNLAMAKFYDVNSVVALAREK